MLAWLRSLILRILRQSHHEIGGTSHWARFATSCNLNSPKLILTNGSEPQSLLSSLATIHKNDKQIKGVSEGTLSLSLDFRLLLFIQLQARFWLLLPGSLIRSSSLHVPVGCRLSIYGSGSGSYVNCIWQQFGKHGCGTYKIIQVCYDYVMVR